MQKSQKLIETVESSIYKYPYQNLLLVDMEGEIWKDVPGLEQYCMVSNLGRVKAIPRFVDRNKQGRILIKERIIKQSVRTFKLNYRTGTLNRCLYFGIGIECKLIQMAVARAVYAAFINPLPDFKENEIFVLHKDLDPLNNRVENLFTSTRQELTRRNIKMGMVTVPDVSKFSDALWQKIKKRSSKPISQYKRTGEFVASFASISDAKKATQISGVCIGQVANEIANHAGGFIWRFGTDTKDLEDDILLRYSPKISNRLKSINQYDLNGNFLANFVSITEAARKFGYNRRGLSAHILNRTPHYGGYIWRYN